MIPSMLFNVNTLDRLSFFGRLFKLNENPETGMWLLLITIFVLMIIVYNLGFARKIKLWQNIIIYIIMFIGCIVLTFLAAFYPIGEALIITAIVLGLYRFRLYKERKAGNVGVTKKQPLKEKSEELKVVKARSLNKNKKS